MEVSGGRPQTIARKGHSVRQICLEYGLSKGLVTREIKRGKLRARRVGRRRVILDGDLQAYLEHA